jgi:DnaK suppressor protein
MATTTKIKGAAKNRYNELRKMLEDRRRELLNEVQGRIRDVRLEGNKERDVLDQGESSEVDIQEDIEFALIQMKSETLTKIDAALRRLEEGNYGDCFECGDQISEARLPRCRSRSAARIARKLERPRSSASGRWQSAAVPPRSSRHVELKVSTTFLQVCRNASTAFLGHGLPTPSDVPLGTR